MKEFSGKGNLAGLLNRNFGLILSGQFISALGSSLYGVAMILYLKELTGSGTVMGAVEMVAMIPPLLLGPFSGTIADSFNRKKIIIRADLVCGFANVLLALPGLSLIRGLGTTRVGSLTLDFSRLEIRVWMVLLATVVVASSYAIFRPALDAAVPDIVPESRLKRANSLLQSSAYLTLLLGASLGGILYGVIGAALLILFNGISFIFSAILELFLEIPPARALSEEEKGLRAYLSRTVEGVRYLWRFPGLKSMVFSFMFTNALFPPVMLSLPFFLEDILGLPPNYYGYMMATYMAGGLIGFLAYGALETSGRTNSLVFNVCYFVIAGLIVLGAFSSYPPLIFVLFGSASMGVAIITLISQTVIQKVVPSEKRGRVYGTMTAVGSALMPLSFAISGILIDLLHQNVRLLLAGVAAVCLIMASFLAANKDVRGLIRKTS